MTKTNAVKTMTTLLVSGLVATGCATSKPAYMPDGRQGHVIDCSSEFLTWGQCYEKAGQLCKDKGYERVAEKADESVSASGWYASSSNSRTLVVACKDGAPAPQ